MTRYVAFLRAINVGGRRVAMADLRREVGSLGYEDVTTHIASGNVLFSTAEKAAVAEAAIEQHLAAALGYPVETFVRTVAQVQAIAAREPFPVAGGDTHLIGFLQRTPTAAEQRAIEGLSGEADLLVVRAKELHWRIHGKSMDTAITPARMATALAQATTTRNASMLRKLAATL